MALLARSRTRGVNNMSDGPNWPSGSEWESVMMRLHDLSVTQQIMLIALAPLACLTIAFSALHLVYASQSSAHAAHGRALAMASFLAPAAEYGVFSRDQNHLEALLQTAMMQEGVIAVAILDETGQTIAARGLPVDPVLSTAPDEPRDSTCAPMGSSGAVLSTGS